MIRVYEGKKVNASIINKIFKKQLKHNNEII